MTTYYMHREDYDFIMSDEEAVEHFLDYKDEGGSMGFDEWLEDYEELYPMDEERIDRTGYILEVDYFDRYEAVEHD